MIWIEAYEGKVQLMLVGEKRLTEQARAPLWIYSKVRFTGLRVRRTHTEQNYGF